MGKYNISIHAKVVNNKIVSRKFDFDLEMPTELVVQIRECTRIELIDGKLQISIEGHLQAKRTCEYCNDDPDHLVQLLTVYYKI